MQVVLNVAVLMKCILHFCICPINRILYFLSLANRDFNSFIHYPVNTLIFVDLYILWCTAGPDTWWLHYPSASGGNQSPIDIVAEEVTFDPELCAHPLHLVYAPARPASAVECTGSGRHGDEDGYYDDDDGSDDAIGETASPSLYNMASVSHGLGGGSSLGTGGLSSLGASGGCPTGRSRESLTVVNTGNAIRVDVANSRSCKSRV